jgi:hypothetical protein
MSALKVVPSAPALTEIVGGLLGREVTFSKVGPSLAFSAANRNTYLGLYQTSDGAPAAVVQCDMRFAAGAATSLAMMPVARTAEWIGARVLPEDGFSNLYEIFNVVSAAFNDVSPDRHVKLVECLPPGTAAPKEFAPLFNGRAARLDYVVDIAEYCSGRLVLLNS